MIDTPLLDDPRIGQYVEGDPSRGEGCEMNVVATGVHLNMDGAVLQRAPAAG